MELTQAQAYKALGERTAYVRLICTWYEEDMAFDTIASLLHLPLADVEVVISMLQAHPGWDAEQLAAELCFCS